MVTMLMDPFTLAEVDTVACLNSKCIDLRRRMRLMGRFKNSDQTGLDDAVNVAYFRRIDVWGGRIFPDPVSHSDGLCVHTALVSPGGRLSVTVPDLLSGIDH